MRPYFDTSVMISLHLRDVHFAAADALMQSAGGIVWTPWQKVEFGNAIRALVARGLLTLADVRTVENNIRASLSAGDMVPRPLPTHFGRKPNSFPAPTRQPSVSAHWTCCTLPPPVPSTPPTSTRSISANTRWHAPPAWRSTDLRVAA